MEQENEDALVQGTATCPVCMDRLADPVQFSCRGEHHFCFECVVKLYLVQKGIGITCPLCRSGRNIILMTRSLSKVYPPRDGVRRTTAEYKRVVASSLVREMPKFLRIEFFQADNSCVIKPIQMALFAHNFEFMRNIAGISELPWKDEFGEVRRELRSVVSPVQVGANGFNELLRRELRIDHTSPPRNHSQSSVS